MSGATVMSTANAYLESAEVLLTTDHRIRGVWPRACAWLLRLALEAALDGFWQLRAPQIVACHNRRAQILVLARYADADTTRRVGYLWWALSRIGHHHGYELAPTAAELRHLTTEVRAVSVMLQPVGDQPRDGRS